MIEPKPLIKNEEKNLSEKKIRIRKIFLKKALQKKKFRKKIMNPLKIFRIFFIDQRLKKNRKKNYKKIEKLIRKKYFWTLRTL